MTDGVKKVCIDCGNPKRPAPYPGPRCATDNRRVKQERKEKAHESHVGRLYGLAPGAYDKLKEIQGGRCALCGHGKGISRALPVDHDHVTGKVRGLLDSRCNDLMGVVDADPHFITRLVQYILSPPADQLKPEDFIDE